ncbi:PHD finger protein rhinoceros [Arctopsyche grandis]|uniref:PHD finger protein rhinoceros n=1 Tax=Arctopsyche grandis TaxID=121162 RepID=UPI00406D7BBF
MSLRGSKRASSRTEEAAVSKRRKAEPEDAHWQARLVNELKSIYNRGVSETPAELFRKDLISAMKLPDSEPLASDEYWVITDAWKQEWERGVQVPVNPDSLPEPTVTEIPQRQPYARDEFKLPKMKYIRLTRDNNFTASEHHLSSAVARAEAACAYDMDACDAAWLRALNGERAKAGVQPLHEEQLERVIEELEIRCWDKIQAIMKSEEGLGIEYDENVICDVCRSPDSEEGNEMVFCDSCNICVHQACYGITAIPSGQWLCSPCGEGVNPICVLCPNLGGAMKSTPSGHKWAHVSCVLWIPEVSIGCAEKMEPITKISAIPPSRWSLICVLCRERTGACIQCSVKTCKTAYHVTCAFKHGLEMRAIIEDENADDGVKLRSYCQRHSVNSKKDKNTGSGSEEEESRRKRRKDMTSEEKSQARAIRLHEIEAEFDRHVSIKDISTHLLDVDQDGIQYVYNYWKLKRKAGHNRPLLPPKTDESDMLVHRQEQADIDKKKMFVQLRQDLERVRNLCYMVSRREKLSRSYFRMREQTFHKQVAVLSGEHSLTPAVMSAVVEANHGPSIYDRLYSHPGAIDHKNEFDSILAQIAGVDSEDDNRKDLNGVVQRTKSVENPYRRLYFNGSSRRSASIADYSGMSSGGESLHDREVRTQNKYRRPIYSTTDDEDAPSMSVSKKKASSKEKDSGDNNGKTSEKKKTRSSITSRSKNDSSSEDNAKNSAKKASWLPQRSTTLRQMEREMGSRPISGTESDELMPMRPMKKYKLPVNIYSDSECSDTNKNEDVNEDKSSNATSDSQQQPFRTKAAVKEFIPIPKGVGKSSAQMKKYKASASDEEVKNRGNAKTAKNKDYPSDLIVPQRQAAKKASENMRSTTANVKNKESNDSVEPKPGPAVEETKIKPKQKSKDKRKDVKDAPSKESSGKKESKSLSSSDLFDFEKESEKDNQDILAYVPQRQAAKKAAEHIKSGMSKVPEGTTDDANKKKEPVAVETPKSKTSSPVKDDKKPRSRKSSSSSTSSSSSYCSSSSSDDDDNTNRNDVPKILLEVKKMYPKSVLSPSRSAILPFLDKGTKVLSSSSDSEADNDSHPTNRQSPPRSRKKSSSSPTQAPRATASSSRKISENKTRVIESVPECGANTSATEREKSSRTSSTASRVSTRTRTRSITGSGNLFDRKDSGQGKLVKGETVVSVSKDSGEEAGGSTSKDSKENRESSKLPFAQWKADKKLKHSKPTESFNTPDNSSSEFKKYGNDSADENNSSEKLTNSETSFEKSSKSHSSKGNSEEKSRNEADQYSATDEKLTDRRVSIDFSQRSSSLPVYYMPNVASDPKKHSDNSNKDSGSDFDKNQTKISSRITKGNNIVKSPKTPLHTDHKISEPSEGHTPRLQESRDKKSLLSDSLEKVSNETYTSDEIQDNGTHQVKSVVTTLTYPNRSIFSPPASKGTGCSELFDFENDIMAVESTAVDDDGFNISQSNEDIVKVQPLMSFFSPDFFFKEDSKEDRGVRETLNLVEKLRMNLKMESKKSNAVNSQSEGNEQDLEIKDCEQNLTSFTECTPYKKAETTEESKEFENCSLSPDEETADDVPSTHRPECDMCDITTPYLSIKEPDNFDFKEEDKACSNASCNEMISQNNFHIESDKMTHYNVPVNESTETVIHNTAMMQNEMLDKIQSVDVSHKEPFMPEHISSKAYDSHLNSNTGNVSNRSESDTVIHHKPLSGRSNDLQESMQTYDNESTLQPPECTPIPSPYNSIKQQTKWSEREMMPARRSSTSSSTSDNSSTSHKQEDVNHSKVDDRMRSQIHSAMLQNMDYPRMPQYHPCSIDALHYSQFSSEASQFVGGPVSLFPSTRINSKLPLPVTETPIFHSSSNMPYQSTNTIMSQMSQMNEGPISFQAPCSAAFTSSSHNIALTTAMIAPLTPKPVSEHSSNHDGESELMSPHHFSLHQSPMRVIDEFPNTSQIQSQVVADKSMASATITSPIQDKKSPSKPTRTSSRFVPHQIKSPCKSPGKSPKQPDNSKSSGSRRGVARNSRGSRSRGRPRGKTTQNIHTYPNIDMDCYGMGTIHNKLIGTVYDLDFDDMSANSVSDLKSMRDRRRSTDVHDRKSDGGYKDSSQSPKFASPSQQSTKRSFTADIKELRPPTPIADHPAAIETPTSPPPRGTNVETVQPFTSIVQPVLPGPVDMRTYSTFEPSNIDAFNNHLLGTFASGTADQQLVDIDEEMEKQLHYALIASSNKSQEPLEMIHTPAKYLERVNEEPAQCYDLSTPKVSLTDPRNQLKVKIKGPFLDANYSTSCIAPVIHQSSIPAVDQPSGMQVLGTPSAVGSATSAMISGTSNLRRMRKKELLRQYCTQDMNMDPDHDPMLGTSMCQITPPVPVTSFSRNVITIPKAVASMTTIPTREDYKAVVDANMEKKRRKMSYVDSQDNLSKLSTPTQLAFSYKRRGRVPKPVPDVSMPSAPKLKIKFGNYVTSEQSVSTEDSSLDYQIPPKKRLASIPRPSVEDLRRESMKYRRKVMADFEEGEKEKKKRIKNEKRKKKKEKRGAEMHVVDKNVENSTKLIIRIARKKEDNPSCTNTHYSGDEGTSTQHAKQSAEYVANPPPPTEDVFDYDPTAPDPLALDSPASLDSLGKGRSFKVSPIRLKLARDAGGSGYVMKDSPGMPVDASSNIEPANPDPLNCPSMSHNNHCEVR